MNPVVADAVLSAVELLGRRKMTTVEAAQVLTVWLRNIGYQQDNWGNFKRPDVATERYHFSDRMLQRQRKYERDWHNITSTPLLDAVDSLIKNSAKTMREIYESASVIADMMLDDQPPEEVHAAAQEMLAQMSQPRPSETKDAPPILPDPAKRVALERVFTDLFAPTLTRRQLDAMAIWLHHRLSTFGVAAVERKEKRKVASDARRAKAQRRELEAMAVRLANKQLAFEHPEIVMATFTGRLDPATGEQYRAEQSRLTSLWTDELARGTKEFPVFASLARPPLLPLRLNDSVYRWVEREGGVDYTIDVTHGAVNTMKIVIGNTGAAWSVDPVSHRPTVTRIDAVGDGYLGGAVSLTPTGLTGRLFMVMAKERRAGAGGRLLSIWCKLMQAYGIRDWVAEAIGEEGEAFLQAMQRRGVIAIVDDRGAFKMVRCL